MIKTRTNAKALAQAINKKTEHLLTREMRGVVAAAANPIRDDAISNAKEIGLSQVGPAFTPGGKLISRKGKIPEGIFAFVAPNEGSKVIAKVAFKKSRDNYHAFFLEFGTVRMAPQPFFMRALTEAKGEAEAAMIKRFGDAMKRMNA